MGYGWALSPDATREQVIAELGKPSSVAKLGAREILVYPKGVRVELEGGKVVAAKGIALSDGSGAAAEPAATPPSEAKPAKPAEKNPAPAPKPRVLTAEEAAEHEYELERAKGQAAMERAVEGLERSHEQAQQPVPAKKFDPTAFAVEVLLKFFLTVAALKLACKYWGAEVFWSGILIVAAADVVVRGGMALAGQLLLGFPTLFYADEAVGAIVMVLLLKKLSINHSIVQAIELTVTTKTFSIVVASFLITVLLRALH